MSTLPLPLVLLLLSLVIAGCSNTDEATDAPQPLAVAMVSVSSPSTVRAERIGTLSATLDGEARTWHALVGTIEGVERASSQWFRFDGDVFRGLIGGYDTPDVDFSTFEYTPQGPASFGTYEGSLLTITFPFERGQSSASMSVSDATDASIIYVQKADFEADIQTNYFLLSDGQLELSQIEAQEGGPCRFEGTFHGTLTRMDGAASMNLENGTFDIDGCLYLEVEE